MENMSEWLTDAFLIKIVAAGISFFAVVLVLTAAAVIAAGSVLARLAQSSGRKKKKQLSVENLGKNLEKHSMHVKKNIFGKKAFDKLVKVQKKKQKDQEKRNIHGPIVFVIDFEGDIKASQVQFLREEISTVIEAADPKKDEVVVRLESRGGVVHGYGLAASQLKRIRDRKIPLTVCVDKIAASGGYMMACMANHIISAPFAVVGSIGVLSQVPNLHRFLKDKNIDYEEITAGEYKRTVSLLGEISEKGREKHLKDIEDVHNLFKDHVKTHRPSLDISQVSTGEYWYGARALDLGLVDEIAASDDYLARLLKDNKRVYKVSLSAPKSWIEKWSKKAVESSLTQRLFHTQPYDMEGAEIPPRHFI